MNYYLEINYNVWTFNFARTSRSFKRFYHTEINLIFQIMEVSSLIMIAIA